MRKPLTKVFEEFGQPVYRVIAPTPVRRHGTVGHGGDHFELYFKVGDARDWVRVDVRLEEGHLEARVAQLITNDALAFPLRFPLRLTITRKKIEIPVDGESVPFTAYAGRLFAFAVGEVGERWIYIHASEGVLERVALRREKPGDLRRFLDRIDNSLEAHRAAQESERLRRRVLEEGRE